jgi:anaerobic magnesium-protoporphyrin IX monomethyl ester cyclase
MKVILINPPHTAIGSRIPDDHLPPLGLLSIGGPLIDAGFSVELIDADLENLPLARIVEEAVRRQPDVVMLGHSGSSSAHDTVVALCHVFKQRLPDVTIVYGGVHPTYHWDEILRTCAAIDVIVRGEGEQTVVDLMHALQGQRDLHALRGIAFRATQPDGSTRVVETPAAFMIHRLDDYRVGWELIDHQRYTYWGGKRAVVVQFSRGCPYLCNYCGQRGYWTQWHHRDPVKLVKEIARLQQARAAHASGKAL